MTRPLGRGLFAALVLVASTACDSVAGLGPASCDIDVESATAETYSDGVAEGGVYMSTAWDGERLEFSSGDLLVLEHHLGATPRSIDVWLALTPDGPLSLAAGNQAELVDVNATSVTLHNATCSDYWFVVTADSGG